MRMKCLPVEDLLRFEDQNFVDIYCPSSLNEDLTSIFTSEIDFQRYHKNFQDLLFKYRKTAIGQILDFIDCEYYSSVITYINRETKAITWTYLYAKDKQKLSLYDHSQTRGNYVYILTNDAYPTLCKIGKAVNPTSRVGQINNAGTVSEWVLRYALPVSDDYKVENLVHRHLAAFRQGSDQGHSREFFEVSFETAVNTLNYYGLDFQTGDPIVY